MFEYIKSYIDYKKFEKEIDIFEENIERLYITTIEHIIDTLKAGDTNIEKHIKEYDDTVNTMWLNIWDSALSYQNTYSYDRFYDNGGDIDIEYVRELINENRSSLIMA